MTTWFQLDCDERAPATARRCLRDALAVGPSDDGVAEPPHDVRVSDVRVSDVELLVSELVSNAVLHGRCTRTEVGIAVRAPASLHVEVLDPGLGGVVRRRAAQLDGTGGVGLLLVEMLSSDWGTETTDRGRVVWFEIDLSPAAATP